jgi:hypothetical protein
VLLGSESHGAGCLFITCGGLFGSRYNWVCASVVLCFFVWDLGGILAGYSHLTVPVVC